MFFQRQNSWSHSTSVIIETLVNHPLLITFYILFSITEALMELAQKEKATLEQWKKQTDPFKEWIVEAKGKFDNLQRGEGYDVIHEQHEKLEVKD